MIVGPAEYMERWYERSSITDTILQCWFQGRTLEEVLAKAKELGHCDPGMVSGVILKGAMVDNVTVSQYMKFPKILRHMKTLIHRTHVRVYVICDASFSSLFMFDSEMTNCKLLK